LSGLEIRERKEKAERRCINYGSKRKHVVHKYGRRDYENGDAYVVAPYNGAGVHVQTDHVTGCHEPKVPPERVDPDVILVLGVADADVPRLALCEALAREVAESGGCVDEDVLAVLCVGREGRDAWC
jgi:hypothetical protein